MDATLFHKIILKNEKPRIHRMTDTGLSMFYWMLYATNSALDVANDRSTFLNNP
mgnify:CR=1 FL=1